MNKNVLIVAAHTDDEALGCAGTIARHVAEGDNVYAIFLADGVSSREDSNNSSHEYRESAAEKARKILGISENYYLGLPDNRLDSIPMLEIVKTLEPIVKDISPQIIYTHHHGDLNIDHRIAHQSILTACRPMPASSCQEIYAFEVVSSTDWANPGLNPFLPNHYVDITNYLEIKNQALLAYEIEMRNAPHTRSINHVNHLAFHRGHTVGVHAAEAFLTIRTIR